MKDGTRHGGVCITLAAHALLVACTELPARVPAPGEAPYFADVAARPKLALVLSSGSLRGLAHIGVLKVLDAQGIRPDLIVGSSVGALVGALSASGLAAAELEQIVNEPQFRLGTGLSRFSPPGERPAIHDFVAHNVRRPRIEQFPVAFAAVATDLQQGCVAVFNAGAAAIAVQASTGLPGVYAPTSIGGHDFADGGMTSPVPVRVARALGAARVIAVDVTFPPRESTLDGLVDRLFQMGLVMLHTLATQEAKEADVLIRPAFPPASEISLARRAALVGVGEQAALEALPRIRMLMAQPVARPAHGDAEWCALRRPEAVAAAPG